MGLRHNWRDDLSDVALYATKEIEHGCVEHGRCDVRAFCLFCPTIGSCLGGLAQILATVCVVALFRERNFAVGITFKKTEVVQAALIGFIILGEGVSILGLVAILVGLTGVLLLSSAPEAKGSLQERLFTRAAGLGLASGLLFAISGVTYRAATLEVGADAPLLRAAVTLSAVTLMQFCAMSLWLRVFEQGQI